MFYRRLLTWLLLRLHSYKTLHRYSLLYCLALSVSPSYCTTETKSTSGSAGYAWKQQDLISIIAGSVQAKSWTLGHSTLLFNLSALLLSPSISPQAQFIWVPVQEGPEADSIKFSLNWLSGIQTKTDGELITAPVGLCSVCNLGNILRNGGVVRPVFHVSALVAQLRGERGRSRCVVPPPGMQFISVSTPLDVWCKLRTRRNTAEAKESAARVQSV